MSRGSGDSDLENDFSPRDSPESSPKKWRTGRGGALWQDVAETQFLEESISALGIPKKDREPRNQDRSSRKRRAEPDPVERFSKRMKHVIADFDLSNLEKVIHRSPADIATFRKRWGNALRDNRRFRYCKPGEALEVAALVSTSKPDEPDLIAKEIAWNIAEEKLDLIYNFLLKLGIPTVVELYEKLRKIEASGGMKTVAGNRRRLPGGVFLQLVKQDLPDDKKPLLNALLREDKKITDKMSMAEKKAQVRKRVHQAAVEAISREERKLPSRAEVLMDEKEAEKRVKIEEENPDPKDGINPDPEDGLMLDLGLNIAEEMADFM